MCEAVGTHTGLFQGLVNYYLQAHLMQPVFVNTVLPICLFTLQQLSFDKDHMA